MIPWSLLAGSSPAAPAAPATEAAFVDEAAIEEAEQRDRRVRFEDTPAARAGVSKDTALRLKEVPSHQGDG